MKDTFHIPILVFFSNGLINSDEKKHPGAFQQLEPPFGTDSMSAWERDDGNSNSKEKVNKQMPS